MEIKERYEAYEKSKRIFLKADKETAERLRINIGDEYSIFPEPKNHLEAFERLENYTGLIILESLVNQFKQDFSINERTLKDRLEIILKFIKKAEKINTGEAFKSSPTYPELGKKYEYLKLKYDYYKNEKLEYYGFNHFFSPLCVSTYAELFLFKEWLINELNNLNNQTESDFEKIKKVYIEKICKAEELAISTFDISLKQDFFAIEQQQINEETRIELTKNYLAETVLKYQNIKNIYKATNDQFYFMTTVAESKLSEDDRIDFIAMVLSNFAINPTSELSEINEENLENILDQLKNIDSIIYETKIAELKFNYVKNKLQEFESNKKTSLIEKKQQKKAYKLNNDFSEQIRLQVSTATFLFDCEEDKIEIVPKELSHDFLLNKFDIDDDILKFYYSPTRQLILDVEYQKMKDSGYYGDIDRVLKPYPINIFGAYYARKKLHTQISFIANKENYYINTKKITHFSDLIPYFIEYSNGFKKGFSDFEKDCIKPYLNEYSDKSDFTSKIYEYISKKIVFEHDWLYNGGSFTLTLNKNNSENYEIIEAFKDGLKQGYFYKAWSITLGNSNVYSKYFKEYYSKQETTKENLHIPKIVINDDESGFKKATIEDYLEQFKDVIINNTYDLLVDALFQYFTTGSFPVLDRKINFKRINKKRLGWELKELYKSLKTDNLDIEYFRFAKDNINLYANEIIENERFLKSKFYKAFTTNPPK